MTARLSPSWLITTEHAQCHDDLGVLVNRQTGKAYGPGDSLSEYASFGPQPATKVAERLAKGARLDEKEREFVARFISHKPQA
jgi:hypothetical protein